MRRTGRTPTEDNAENGQNHMAEAFCPLYTDAMHSIVLHKKKSNPKS